MQKDLLVFFFLLCELLGVEIDHFHELDLICGACLSSARQWPSARLCQVGQNDGGRGMLRRVGHDKHPFVLRFDEVFQAFRCVSRFDSIFIDTRSTPDP